MLIIFVCIVFLYNTAFRCLNLFVDFPEEFHYLIGSHALSISCIYCTHFKILTRSKVRVCLWERHRKSKNIYRNTKYKDNMFVSLDTFGHKLTIDPFGCFKLFILMCQLLIKHMQGKAPPGFSLNQCNAFTVNLCKNTISKMEIFGMCSKSRGHPFEYGNLCVKVALFGNQAVLTLNNRDQLRESDLFIDRNSQKERQERRRRRRARRKERSHQILSSSLSGTRG